MKNSTISNGKGAARITNLKFPKIQQSLFHSLIPINTLSQSKQIVQMIKIDHENIQQDYSSLRIDKSIRRKKEKFKKWEKLINSHLEAEEKTIYTFASTTQALKKQTMKNRMEHGAIQYLLTELKKHKTSELWLAGVESIYEAFEKHFYEEETVFLPKFSHELSKLSEKEAERLVRKFQSIREKTSGINFYSKIYEFHPEDMLLNFAQNYSKYMPKFMQRWMQ